MKTIERLVTGGLLLLLLAAQPAAAQPARGCREVTLSGPVQGVTCFVGRCAGWLRTSSGTNGRSLLVKGWGWREGQVVRKTILVCDQ